MRLDGTALGPFSLLPHPALSGRLERQTSHSLCTPPHPRFTLYSRPPRTSPSGSRPGTGCERSRAKVPTTRQDGGGLQRRTLRKRAVAALGHPAFQLGRNPVSYIRYHDPTLPPHLLRLSRPSVVPSLPSNRMLPLCLLDAGSTRFRPRLQLCQHAPHQPLDGLYIITLKNRPWKESSRCGLFS